VLGWALVIWGTALYWWSGVLYLRQGVELVRRFPLGRVEEPSAP
jgi:cardiolipin synthase